MTVKAFSVKKDAMGSLLLTNISGFGEDNIFAPQTNATRSLACVVFCAPKEKVVVVDGQPAIRKLVNMNFTWDARHLGIENLEKFEASLRRVWEKPEEFL